MNPLIDLLQILRGGELCRTTGILLTLFDNFNFSESTFKNLVSIKSLVSRHRRVPELQCYTNILAWVPSFGIKTKSAGDGI